MGRRKGYQQPLTEMSQVNDYVFSTEESSYPPNQRSLPFFFKNLNNSSHSQSDKIIGASYSHFDRPSGSRSRTSISPERTSIGSVGSLSPRLKTSKALKRLSVFDDDDDWDDGIEEEFLGKETKSLGKLYPDLEYVKPEFQQPSTAPARPVSLIRENYKDILEDPFVILNGLDLQDYKHHKLTELLNADSESLDLNELKKQSWKGLPTELRGLVWQLLLGYIPSNPSRRQSVLQRKRKEYNDTIEQIFNKSKDQIIWHQIIIDVPRTNPSIKLYSYPVIQRLLERLLYVWAIRHPASGYVQGINDLATPILQVFLQSYLVAQANVANLDPDKLDVEILNHVEADTFWCLTKILDTIQDNYIHEQPGIMRQVESLANLTLRIDEKLYTHIKEQNLEFLQFSFRWMNCMLMRELKMDLIVRMWDTYISEFPKGFNEFHVYVCCAFLMKFSEELKEMEFQEMIMYLQDTSKTENWDETDVEMLLSEAYIWQTLYRNATAHLK